MKKSSKATKQARIKDTPVVSDLQPSVAEDQAAPGSRRMQEELEEYHSVSPVLTAGDVDASWQEAENSGEEAVGGHAPTPDQDIVDEIGRALGIELEDNHELRTHEEVLADRDRHRWELDRRS